MQYPLANAKIRQAKADWVTAPNNTKTPGQKQDWRKDYRAFSAGPLLPLVSIRAGTEGR